MPAISPFAYNNIFFNGTAVSLFIKNCVVNDFVMYYSVYLIALIWVCLMQRRLIYKIVTGSLMFSLLMTNVATAGSGTEKSLLKYSPQLLAGQWNPWVLPEVPEKTMAFQCPADTQSEQSYGKPMGAQEQARPLEFKKRLSGRFVTPGILESLKQQQIQTQMTPSYEPTRQLRPQQRMQQQPVTRFAEKNYYYGEPSYGMGSVNPLFDAPAVSPWGNGPDIIYRGQSFPESFSGVMPGSSPWVPSEAIGGLPPIHVPPFAGSSNWRELNSAGSNSVEAENTERQIENNLFNPFTFAPSRSWP